MKKILITGGSGLVGNAIKNVINHELSKKYEFIFVSSKEFNLYRMEDTIKMFELYKPNYVIHLAACVGGLYRNMNNKVEMLEKNLMINFNVIKCAHDYGVEKLIGALSTCIFPDKISYPINESMLHDGKPHESNDAYSYAKRMLETQCKAYRDNYGDNFVCFIPTNIYGAYDQFNLEDAHVLPALIHKCYLAKKNNIDFVIRGSGKPLRQFIYSEDLAKLILWMLENYDEKDSLILSGPESDEVSIKTIAEIIAKTFEYENRIAFDTKYSDGQYKKTADNYKLMNIINNFEFTPIELGIKNTIDFFVSNYDILRK